MTDSELQSGMSSLMLPAFLGQPNALVLLTRRAREGSAAAALAAQPTPVQASWPPLPPLPPVPTFSTFSTSPPHHPTTSPPRHLTISPPLPTAPRYHRTRVWTASMQVELTLREREILVGEELARHESAKRQAKRQREEEAAEGEAADDEDMVNPYPNPSPSLSPNPNPDPSPSPSPNPKQAEAEAGGEDDDDDGGGRGDGAERAALLTVEPAALAEGAGASSPRAALAGANPHPA